MQINLNVKAIRRNNFINEHMLCNVESKDSNSHNNAIIMT